MMSLLWLFENLRVEPFGVIPVSNLTGKGGPSTLKQVETLASYNWSSDTEKPIIIVPGAPKEMKSWLGGKLPEDQGDVVYDINHHKMPDCPMEPVFHSILVQQGRADKNFDLQQYDLVTDCINLQKLFAFCKADEGCGFFRIDLERIGRTVLASRVEAQDVVHVDFLSYDQGMKRACCVPLQSELESNHFRVVSYKFGDIHLLVNVEVDCAQFDESSRRLVEQGPLVNANVEQSTTLPCSTLNHVESGTVVASSLMTVTTSPDGKGFPSFVWPLLFFSTLDSVIVGWWTDQAAFKKPVIYKLADVNKLLKPLPYSTLSKVYDLLKKIVNFMRRNDETIKTSLIWQGRDFIEIYEKAPAAPGAISQSMKDHFHSSGVGDSVVSPEKSA